MAEATEADNALADSFVGRWGELSGMPEAFRAANMAGYIGKVHAEERKAVGALVKYAQMVEEWRDSEHGRDRSWAQIVSDGDAPAEILRVEALMKPEACCQSVATTSDD